MGLIFSHPIGWVYFRDRNHSSCLGIIANMDNLSSEYFELNINQKKYKVGPEIPAETSLNTFIREYAYLPGTKFMCREGGCGACIVTMQVYDPITKTDTYQAVNSCLIPVRACQGSNITTIEGIGNKHIGYHKIQLCLAKFNGSQCGFCSPGMVMNMYSLLMKNPAIKMKEVENSFGGNICRCTGYRPIMDAFKSLCSDAPDHLKKIADIEDISVCQERNGLCEKSCNEKCNGTKTGNLTQRLMNGKTWYTPKKVQDIWNIFKEINTQTYMLLNGNTAQGVQKTKSPDVYINMKYIQELKDYKITKNSLDIGANMTLTETMIIFDKLSSTENFKYLKVLSSHIDLVANVPVRNVATLAGNLWIKHNNNSFPSDVFIILETVGAQIVMEGMDGCWEPISVQDFLKSDLNKALIKRIILPALANSSYHVKTYKIMPRAQNVHAYINAGFCFKLDKNIIIESRIIYGGIHSKFIHAHETESFLIGKNILDNEVLAATFDILSKELDPEIDLLKPSPSYRKKASICLLYKFVLGINSKMVQSKYISGAFDLDRKLSQGILDGGTRRKNWPENKIGSKLEGIIQSSGEAEYVNDLPPYPGQLYGALVLSHEAVGEILNIDPTEALVLDGVTAFYSAKDIPGVNSFMVENIFRIDDEEIFCSSEVLYAGQPVGVIVAQSYELAIQASKMVKITYKNKRKPLTSIKQVFENNDTSRIKLHTVENPGENFTNKSDNCINGDLELGSQYHFTMEPQSCICVPIEDGMNVFSSTQWMQNIQATVASCLKLPENSINMQVRRIGGGFGCKITRSAMIATACAVAAFKLNRPVRMILNIETNMEAIGKRSPAYSQYKVGFNNEGKIEEAEIKVYSDNGCKGNDPYNILITGGVRNCYNSSNWKIEVYDVMTNIPACSWMRGPGTLEGILTTEDIMENIATTLGKNPLDIRIKNLGNFPILNHLMDLIKKTSNYHEREEQINIFNKQNRWKKRGISLLPMNFYLEYFFNYHAAMSIYAEDGTVSVTTGGIEMGQGLNTKVAQVCAYALGIPIDMIKIKPANTFTAPNDGMSGASITSDTCCHSVLKCCEILAERLSPIKKKLTNPSWTELIKKAFEEDVDLYVSYMNSAMIKKEIKSSSVFAIAVSEVEIDVLTGNHNIIRTDILEDAGESLSPDIDLGQIEGAFVMGLGYMLSERIVYDPQTGMNLANRTWHYWPPGAKDIPADFRVNIARDMSNPNGVLRSKSTGEPPICLAYSVVCAIRQAIKSARKETGEDKIWFNLDQPCSVEKIFMMANTDINHLKI